MIKVIAFDIGGVLVNYSNEMYYSYLSKKYRINKRVFLKELDRLGAKLDSGQISLRELEKGSPRALGSRHPNSNTTKTL